ncbi:MAG: nucleotidyltransferase family protein [Saprospiraceae bacterium]|jgi:D-glycero-alpha-D-manno-heptose 1-phosphate guanylyltransferase|nr:nucleotidyltransferase family protein [Saprospiraceae bacterium]
MSHVTEAVILAGGLGTRLQSTVPGLPKCMAPVAGRPFLDFVMDFLFKQGIEKCIFSLGHMSESVVAYVQENLKPSYFTCCIEDQPLGTGGAARKASELVLHDDFLLVNGDTLFEINLETMVSQHVETKASLTMGLRQMPKADRYGTVRIEEDSHRILEFLEKKPQTSGLINGGVYLIQKKWLTELDLPEKCSFEKDILEKEVKKGKIFGHVSDQYFIDIGVPEDFLKAQQDFLNKHIQLQRK